jgi:hypothetical protein
MIFLISISLQKEKKLPKKFFSFLHEEKVKTKIKKIKAIYVVVPTEEDGFERKK